MRFIKTKQEKLHKLVLFGSLLLAVVIWLLESVFHYFVFDDGQDFLLIPGTANELWMRTVICSLVVVVGAMLSRQVRTNYLIEEEKRRTFKATMHSVMDIVGNTFISIKVLTGGLEAKEHGHETERNILAVIEEASAKLEAINAITRPKERRFSKGIYEIAPPKQEIELVGYDAR